jgi:iron(II)-dependent oxidoreductase
LPNDPVVGIIWYEALAFARWLTETLRSKQLLPDQYEVRLPSEAEWEKAARGGVQLPTAPLIGPVVATPEITLRQNDRPRRVYPWGDQPDVDRANYDESKVGIPTAVGTFARGASPYGAQDMSGNVWEWTRSVYQPYPYDPQDGREQLDSKDTRVVRGGAFSNPEGYARCAYRNLNDPDGRFDNLGFRVVVVPF